MKALPKGLAAVVRAANMAARAWFMLVGLWMLIEGRDFYAPEPLLGCAGARVMGFLIALCGIGLMFRGTFRAAVVGLMVIVLVGHMIARGFFITVHWWSHVMVGAIIVTRLLDAAQHSLTTRRPTPRDPQRE